MAEMLPGEKAGSAQLYESLKVAPKEAAEEKQMSPRHPQGGVEFTGSPHFSIVGLSRENITP